MLIYLYKQRFVHFFDHQFIRMKLYFQTIEFLKFSCFKKQFCFCTNQSEIADFIWHGSRHICPSLDCWFHLAANQYFTFQEWFCQFVLSCLNHNGSIIGLLDFYLSTLCANYTSVIYKYGYCYIIWDQQHILSNVFFIIW